MQPFQPTCSVTKTHIEVGETTRYTGSHVPSSTQVTWSFDHGDGFVDHQNPSTAVYEKPGTYAVTARAKLSSGDVWPIACGNVTVTLPTISVTYHCHISDTRIYAGKTTTFTGSTQPSNLPVTWVFDHGDGYSEQQNPSVSLYNNPGSYAVTAYATHQGITTEIHCGTVHVIEPPAAIN